MDNQDQRDTLVVGGTSQVLRGQTSKLERQVRDCTGHNGHDGQGRVCTDSVE